LRRPTGVLQRQKGPARAPFAWSARYATAAPRRVKVVQNIPMQAPDLERLVTVTMPFGKYKGRLIADLPGHYLNWFAREGFPRGELGQLLALMHELDHNGLKGLLDPLRKRG
jgi:uncharacterized protein